MLFRSLLASGKSSRLIRNVREKQRLVTSINTEVLAEKWPGFFQIYASMPVEKWEKARNAIFAELRRFQTEKVPEEDRKSVV